MGEGLDGILPEQTCTYNQRRRVFGNSFQKAQHVSSSSYLSPQQC